MYMHVAIIGGGAAGLMCAASLLESNEEITITLFERNDGLGKKVIISGGGRCNVTTGIQDIKKVLTRYPRGNKFLNSAIHQFPPKSVYDWFEQHGVPLKTEEDLRVFPVSNDGHDIVRVFEKLFAKSRVNILLKTTVEKIEKEAAGKFLIFTKQSAEPITVDRVVLTTGGQAYRHTGSQGDGYAFALSLGHTITALAPSLNAFFTEESWPANISGLSFESATITARRKGKTEFTGPFLFTHKGISGPAVFALSSLVAFEKYDKQDPLEISLDLFPQEKIDSLFERIESLARLHGQKQFSNILHLLMPKSLSEILVRQLGLPDKRGNEMAKKELRECAEWLKRIPLHVVQRGAGDEFVTAGGIELSEVNPSTMESLICPGLYFAGEILNIDGFTGGFNLQASWATGRLAGASITK